MAHVDVCIWHEGNHFPGRFCPHDAEFDEFGRVLPDGWTVQQETGPQTP